MEFGTVCIFCGSNSGLRPAYTDAAHRAGSFLAETGATVVTGGGRVGLMGAVADGALAAGGRVIGVIPRHLEDWELSHQSLTELRVVGSMHERKAMMADLSDAFVALPGGIGTLDELAEILTWAQLGLHAKPVGLLDVDGYFQPLLSFFDHAAREGFLDPALRACIRVERDIARLLAGMAATRPTGLGRPPRDLRP